MCVVKGGMGVLKGWRLTGENMQKWDTYVESMTVFV